MDALAVVGRPNHLFRIDSESHERLIAEAIAGSRVLVHGGAGSIGKAVVAQIFRRRPRVLHVVDISENNLVELVRDLHSSCKPLDGESRFLPIDMGSIEMAAFLASEPRYDYVLNLAAM